MLELIDGLVARRESFAFETTLADRLTAALAMSERVTRRRRLSEQYPIFAQTYEHASLNRAQPKSTRGSLRWALGINTRIAATSLGRDAITQNATKRPRLAKLVVELERAHWDTSLCGSLP